MAARYDAEGNFIYPEGFDADTQEWKPGHETQRVEWEAQYALAQERFLAHKKQKSEAKAADAAAEPAADASSDSSSDSVTSYTSESPAAEVPTESAE